MLSTEELQGEFRTQLQRLDPRVQLIRTERREGLVRSRILGKTQIIAFIHCLKQHIISKQNLQHIHYRQTYIKTNKHKIQTHNEGE